MGLGATNTTNSTNVAVFIGGGQDANTNSSVNINLTGSAVGSAGLGLNNTSVLTNGSVTVGSAAAVQIAVGDSAVFTLATASGAQTITVKGNTGDTLQGQVDNLNSQLQGFGISASLDLSGKLQFTSANAFSVSGISTGAANLVPISTGTADTANNTGLNNLSVVPIRG